MGATLNISQAIRYLMVLILTAVFFTSCGATRRGSLSDAMDKASDDYEGERVVQTSDDDDDEDYDNDEPSMVESAIYMSTGTNEPSFNRYGFSFGSGLMSSNDFYGLNHFNLYMGLGRNSFTYLSAGVSWSPVQKTSYLSRSIEGSVVLLNAGIGHKAFTTPRYTFLGHYFCFGANYNLMLWTYKNSIGVERYDEYGNFEEFEYIRHDALQGFDFYAGTGVNLMQTKHLDLGGEISPGMILWFWNTQQGFKNDVFDPFFYIKFKFHLMLK